MSAYDYYLQDDKTQSIRRYLKGRSTGERWCPAEGKWLSQCAPRECCLPPCTPDRVITEEDAILRGCKV